MMMQMTMIGELQEVSGSDISDCDSDGEHLPPVRFEVEPGLEIDIAALVEYDDCSDE